MLSRIALAATLATLLSYTAAAPAVHGLETRQDNGLGTPRQIQWLKTTPGGQGQADPGVYCLNVNSPGFSSRTIGMLVSRQVHGITIAYQPLFANHSSTCVSGGPGAVDGSGHPADVQLFYYNLGATQIKVQDTTTGEVSCVDFGNTSNGSPITIAACDVNAPGQKLYITDDFHIAVENGPGQCMDVQAESGIQPIRPYGILKSVQSWQVRFPCCPAFVEHELKKTCQCTAGNENQVRLREATLP
jgi:hypothetical protein